jgi:two-component system, cell cycle response regulator DivK
MPLVLIVDDNASNRKLARDVLGVAGFETLEAATGAEGIAIATQHTPDVILMDLHLPDMSGVDAAHTLKDAERTARIPVVATSAASLAEGADWLEAVGFVGWIEKPIQIHSFAKQVLDFCRSGR